MSARTCTFKLSNKLNSFQIYLFPHQNTIWTPKAAVNCSLTNVCVTYTPYSYMLLIVFILWFICLCLRLRLSSFHSTSLDDFIFFSFLFLPPFSTEECLGLMLKTKTLNLICNSNCRGYERMVEHAEGISFSSRVEKKCRMLIYLTIHILMYMLYDIILCFSLLT